MVDVKKLAFKIISQTDWLEKEVEHKTPSGQTRTVKVKSLPPEEREKYKPKKQESDDYDEVKVDKEEMKENADWRKNTIDKLKSEKEEADKGGKLKQFKHKIKKKFEKLKMVSQQDNVLDKMFELGFEPKNDGSLFWRNPDTGEKTQIQDKGKKLDLNKRIKDEISKHEVNFQNYKTLKQEYDNIDRDIELLQRAANIAKEILK